MLDARLLTTEYQSPGGLSFKALHEAFGILAALDVVGLEITEYEGRWPNGTPSSHDELLCAIEPVLARLLGVRALSAIE